jgi:hypothetical protein
MFTCEALRAGRTPVTMLRTTPIMTERTTVVEEITGWTLS